ncbi:TPA: hypothetical protein IVO45_001917 [Enterococcus faecium]|nr:hypothetical protein [Enterococcus faecium]HAP7341903.1 hypothetical protein [Enterococcus faecium]
MKKKFTFGLVAVCGLVLAGCYGGSSATSSSSAKSGSADGGGVFNRIRQKSPILYRWVMNAVRYEGYRW